MGAEAPRFPSHPSAPFQEKNFNSVVLLLLVDLLFKRERERQRERGGSTWLELDGTVGISAHTYTQRPTCIDERGPKK